MMNILYMHLHVLKIPNLGSVYPLLLRETHLPYARFMPKLGRSEKNHSKTFNVPVNRQTDYDMISHVSKKYPWLCTRRSERSENHRKHPIFSEHLLYPMVHPDKAANANSSKTHMAYSLSATKFSCTNRSPICEAQCGFCQLNSAKPGGPTDTKSPLIYLLVYAVLVWSSQWKVPCFPGNSLWNRRLISTPNTTRYIDINESIVTSSSGYLSDVSGWNLGQSMQYTVYIQLNIGQTWICCTSSLMGNWPWPGLSTAWISQLCFLSFKRPGLKLWLKACPLHSQFPFNSTPELPATRGKYSLLGLVISILYSLF